MLDPSLAACAPFVAPATLASVIRVESGGQPFAININRGPRIPTPRTAEEAAGIARAWIARGYSVDMGLMQVNSRNLARLGYTVDHMFDPCTSVRAGATILAANYVDAAKRRGPGQLALLDALSAYNTGSFTRGYSNGYVSKYFTSTRYIMDLGAYRPPARPSWPDPYSSELSVFSRKDDNVGSAIASDQASQPGGFD